MRSNDVFELPEDFSIETLYDELSEHREKPLEKAELFASLSVPSAFPPEIEEGETGDKNDVSTSFTDLTGNLVNNLVNKLSTALFPPSIPFFNLNISDDDVYQEVLSQGDPEEIKAELESNFANAENKCMESLEATGSREIINLVMEQLVVAGNVMVIYEEGKLLVKTLRDYVVTRDDERKVSEMVVKFPRQVTAIKEELLDYLPDSIDEEDDDTYVMEYHYIKYNYDTEEYVVWKFFEDELIDESEHMLTYTAEELIYQPLYYKLPIGNYYGTSKIEEHHSDIEALRELARVETELATLASRFFYLVKEGARIDPKYFANMRNGQAISGSEGDITMLSPTMSIDIAKISVLKDEKIRSLSQSFLYMPQSIRDRERVTAEEIRTLAQELDSGNLGSVYSVLANTLQRRMALWLVELNKDKLGESESYVQAMLAMITPSVTTGLSALSRYEDLMNLQEFLQEVINLGEVNEQMLPYMKIDSILNRLARLRSIDAEEFIRSYEEARAIQEQAMQEQMAMENEAQAEQMAIQTAGAGVQQMMEG